MSERFQPTRRSEERYYRDLLGTVRKYFEQGYEYAAHLLSVPEWLDTWAEWIARSMVTYQLAENAKSWREAARIAGKGPEIYAALQRELRGRVGTTYRNLIRENASLIKSLPSDVATEATRHIATLQRQGRRAEEISKSAVLSHVSRTKARLIARTEVAKASAALTEARAEDLGLEYFVWRTSKDTRVRPSHRHMQDVLVRFDDPPSPEALIGIRSTLGRYTAGNAPNCRCYSEPLLGLSQVRFPHKVFYAGRIQMVTLARFRQMAGVRESKIAA